MEAEDYTRNNKYESVGQEPPPAPTSRNDLVVVDIFPDEDSGDNREQEGAVVMANNNKEQEGTVVEYKKQNGHHKEEEKMVSPLPEDVYSLLYVCHAFSGAFFFSLAVIAGQLTVIILIILDLIDPEYSTNNPLQVPPGVNIEVTIACALSMILAVAIQHNLLTFLSRMSINAKSIPTATRFKFVLSAVLQLSAGGLMLFAQFVLNLQSETVLGLMLNFAALEFVSCIQQTFFWLAANGYMSQKIQDETELVTNFTITKKESKPSMIRGKQVWFSLVTLVLLIFYSSLVKRQIQGDFLCKKIWVQFGDGFRADLPFFSGSYQNQGRVAGRALYTSEYPEWGARFAYCPALKSWTFSGPAGKGSLAVQNGTTIAYVAAQQNTDPCDYWLKSTETSTYDITETMSSPWFIFDVTRNQTVPIDFFAMVCNDCDGNRATHSCSGHGSCVDNTCICNDGRMGVTCQYPVPCPKLELDQRTKPFPYDNQGRFLPASSYDLLLDENTKKPVEVNNKAVYVATTVGSGDSVVLNSILFNGRRWGLFSNTLGEQIDSIPPGFNEWPPTARAYYLSEPFDLGTPTDDGNPVENGWFGVRKWLSFDGRAVYRVDPNMPASTVFLCPICQPIINDCLGGATCLINNTISTTGEEAAASVVEVIDESTFFSQQRRGGTCLCPIGAKGALCEYEMTCQEYNSSCFENRGNCTDHGSCSCQSGFTGSLCQFTVENRILEVDVVSPMW